MRTEADWLLAPRRRAGLAFPLPVAAVIAAALLAAPSSNGQTPLPPGGTSCPLPANVAHTYAQCYRSPTVSVTIPSVAPLLVGDSIQ